MENSGQFKKGCRPHNYGQKGVCSRHDHTQKGHQGFLPREVLVINHDGSIKAEYPSVKSCASAMGVSDLHSIVHACQGKFLCRGFKIMYKEDWSPYGDYHYKPTRGRDIDGKLKKNHGLSKMYRMRQSDETKQRMREKNRELGYRNAHDPNCKFGKPKGKKVWCYTTDEHFCSVAEAARHFGIKPHYISSAIHRCGTTKKLKFYLDKI